MLAKRNVEVHDCCGLLRAGTGNMCRYIELLRLVEGEATIESVIHRNKL